MSTDWLQLARFIAVYSGFFHPAKIDNLVEIVKMSLTLRNVCQFGFKIICQIRLKFGPKQIDTVRQRDLNVIFDVVVQTLIQH